MAGENATLVTVMMESFSESTQAILFHGILYINPRHAVDTAIAWATNLLLSGGDRGVLMAVERKQDEGIA